MCPCQFVAINALNVRRSCYHLLIVSASWSQLMCRATIKIDHVESTHAGFHGPPKPPITFVPFVRGGLLSCTILRSEFFAISVGTKQWCVLALIPFCICRNNSDVVFCWIPAILASLVMRKLIKALSYLTSFPISTNMF